MYHSTLEAIGSTMDSNGNRYWAFRYICHATGKSVEGMISGGESNIIAITIGWTTPNEWDRGFIKRTINMPKREFDRRTAGWPYAGCSGEELQAFIRSKL